MSKLAIESRLGSLTSYILPTGAYAQTQLGLTNLIRQYTGANSDDKFAGPIPVGIFRPITTALAIPATFPWAMAWSADIDWVFFADGATGANTRRIQMATFDRRTSAFDFKGAINITFPTGATAHTIRGFRMDYQTYSTGTAATNGTAVTGTSTAWLASGISVGSRIGFGSTDPNAITTWYDVTARTNDTTITLGSSAGIIADGAYVIEELRAIMVTTNATAANGGLFIVKGLSYSAFTGGPTAISAATNVDNIRACYWLKDADTVTMQAVIGIGLDTKTSWTAQDLYVLNTVANPVCYKYNIRADLTAGTGLASGISKMAYTLVTGAHGAPSGTVSQSNNCRLETIAHGPGSGQKCLYFTTTTKQYRTADVVNITAGSVTWAGDSLAENPPGTTNTFAVTNTINSTDYSSIIDRFVLSTSNKQYLSKHVTDGSPMERVFTSNNTQLNQVIADPTLTPYPASTQAYYSCWTNAGVLYLTQIGTTATTNIVYSIPIGADWEYVATTNQRLIFPTCATLNATSFTRVYINTVKVLGGDTLTNLGSSPEGVKLYYRTSGISDNSGAWTELSFSGDLTNVPPADEIQFSATFKTVSNLCIPDRITGLCLIYEDGSTDSHYQPSVGNSNISTSTFAWRFSTAFGSSVPRLKIQLFNAVTGAGPLVDDDSTTQTGTWEKSTDGGSNWVAYDTNDKANDITYIRFTPASLGANIRVRAQLSQY